MPSLGVRSPWVAAASKAVSLPLTVKGHEEKRKRTKNSNHDWSILDRELHEKPINYLHYYQY